eukprot:COSAG05_NODE_1596_length_4455_cov_3.362259_5_plen_120_part_00
MRQSSGRCVTLDAAAHLHDRNWLLPPPLPPLANATRTSTAAGVDATGGTKGSKRKGPKERTARIPMPGRDNGRPTTAGTARTAATQNTAARAEAKQRRRMRARQVRQSGLSTILTPALF